MPQTSGAIETTSLHFSSADGFRALAIFTVFLGHLATISSPVLTHHLVVSDLVSAFDPVCMLFVLSGFLLSGPFLRGYLHGDEFPLVGNYLFARFLRIYPLYLASIVLISLLIALQHMPPSTWDIISHVFFLQDEGLATTQSISGPLWTMAVDVQFYLALPCLFWCLRKFTPDSSRRNRIAVLFVTLSVICIASVAYRYVAALIFRPQTLEAGIVYIRQLPGMLCVFGAGIALRVFMETRYRAWGTSARFWTIVLLGALSAKVVSTLIHQGRLHELTATRYELTASLWAVEDLVAAMACVLLLGAFVGARENPISRIFSSPLCTFAASISYAFYLFHLPVIELVAGPHAHQTWLSFLKTGALSLIVLVPFCYLVFRTVESPFLKLKGMLRRWRFPQVPMFSDLSTAGAKAGAARTPATSSDQA